MVELQLSCCVVHGGEMDRSVLETDRCREKKNEVKLRRNMDDAARTRCGLREVPGRSVYPVLLMLTTPKPTWWR